MATTIVLADDHRMMRDGLRLLLEKRPGLRVVGEADDGRGAIELAEEHKPDIVVMDVTMRDLNGIEATRRIMARLPRTKVIALSMHSDKRYVIQMLQAGAAAYLLKDCASDDLVRAIDAVRANQRFVSAGVAEALIEYVASNGEKEHGGVYTDLTPREREVLQLLAEGLTSKEIAARLNLSTKTVETHRRDMMQALDLHNVAELTRYAIREGLITP